MARRRFFMSNSRLTESYNKKAEEPRYLLEDVFTELNRLYEADETAGNETNDEKAADSSAEVTAGSSTNIQPDNTDKAEVKPENKPAADNSTENKNDKADNKKLPGNIAEIKKEIKNTEIPEPGIKLTGTADKLYDQLITQLQKSKLPSAVEILKIVAADDKLSKLLKHGFHTEADEESQIDVTVNPDVSLKTSSLVPTQNVVVVSNSLDNLVNGYFVTGKGEEAVQNTIDYTNYFAGDAPVPQPFVYKAGGKNYIIDGHHRWSQAYCMNPFGTLKCTVVEGPDISADAALKNFQAAIAVDEPALPTGSGSGVNLFEAGLSELGKTVAPMTEETAEKIMTAGKGSEAVKNISAEILEKFKKGSENLKSAKALLISNALRLKKTVTPGANDREIMPQANIKKVKAVLAGGAMPLAQ